MSGYFKGSKQYHTQAEYTPKVSYDKYYNNQSFSSRKNTYQEIDHKKNALCFSDCTKWVIQVKKITKNNKYFSVSEIT